MRSNIGVRVGILGLLILNLANVTGGRSHAANSGASAIAGVLGQAPEQTNKDARVFYVATNGNDAWSGTLPQPNQGNTDGPWASLLYARDAIRVLGAGGSFTGPVIVYLRGGTYTLSKTIVFSHEDSGTRQSPRIYKAYPNEIPILSGGREIRGWKRVSSVADLPHGGLGAPPMQENLWMAEVQGISDGNWVFHQLFVNGQRRQRARIPNRGFFNVDGLISADNPARFRFRSGDIDPAWVVGGNAEVVALLKWGGFRLLLKNVDSATQTAVVSARRQPWGNDDKPRYWIENIPQALDIPGEWYLDRSNGVAYYHALPGEDMSRATVTAPFLQQLIRFEGEAEAESEDSLAHDISLEDLTLSYTDWSNTSTGWIHSFTEWSKTEDGHIDEQSVIDVPAAVEGVGAHSCSVTRCTFTHLGGYAVQFHGGSKENHLTKSLMTDLGAGGVKIGDGKSPSFDAQATSGNVVSDNSIHDIGIVYPTGVGVWIGESSSNTIAHNEIYDTFYSGISVGWTWSYGPSWARDNIIEFNHIYNIGRGVLSDLGCIYTVGVQPGTVVRNNLCHDVSRYEHGYGGWGIYTDEGSSNILIQDNVVYRTQDGGFHQNYGRDNVVRNNVFASGQNAQLRRTHNEDHTSFVFEHNIFYWRDGTLLDGKWDDGHYKFDNNLYFRTQGDAIDFAGKSFGDWRKGGQDVHSLLGSPLFVDPEHGNFSLKPGSPALKTGFQPIDLGGVGPRKTN
jgi:parallel beta-helix repeat protein